MYRKGIPNFYTHFVRKEFRSLSTPAHYLAKPRYSLRLGQAQNASHYESRLSTRLDSNQGPIVYKTTALPTELRVDIMCNLIDYHATRVASD